MDKEENKKDSEVTDVTEEKEQEELEMEEKKEDDEKEGFYEEVEEDKDDEVEEKEDQEEEKDLEEDQKEEGEDMDEHEENNDIKFRGFNPNEDKEESLVYDMPVRRKSGMKKFIIWLSILAILALVVGWFITTNVFKGEGGVKVEQDTTPSPTPTPTPAPEQKLNRSEWSIEVLNGSGTSGLAKKIADQLKDLGYNVIKVGNADKQTYTESQILVKSDLKEKIDPVIADIKDVIKIASGAGELKDSTASAQIIIGKEN